MIIALWRPPFLTETSLLASLGPFWEERPSLLYLLVKAVGSSGLPGPDVVAVMYTGRHVRRGTPTMGTPGGI